ncbi:MAG: hypothetical protein GWM98_10420, partial [Nitrospinaceae bacterium]|nr:hypothetical protein [Nitrospinaceae bacterium]NIR54828.1 hypothetical protein [Nitrospinaceae bacterium]NIS85253.1 hypothetical protein [Nitrospinaceae bacterium]NIT82066.1 hypothetical protein [Nitrospinaceae bacterium]NIU44327.1 hypothetical protein [Nitrospinaceae bacterium]
FENDYRIAPLAPGETFTQWTSTNSALGPLKGMFSLVENSILSSFSSSEGRYTGVEVLNQRG